MKIAISSLGENLDSPYDFRFKQAPHVLILDSKNLQYNELTALQSGRRPNSDKDRARSLIQNGVNVVVTGTCSETVSEMLDEAHVRLFDGKAGSVKENVAAFYRKELDPKISEHYSIDDSEDPPPVYADRSDLWELIPGHIPDPE